VITNPLDVTSRSPEILALDLGTSSVKCAAYGLPDVILRGEIVRAPIVLRCAAPGEATLDPLELRDAVERAVLAAAADTSGSFAAIGISCFWHSLMGVDRAGEPVTPVITWADARAAGEAERLREEMDQGRVRALTGCPVHGVYWPAKLRWLQRAHPEWCARVWRWMSAAEWVARTLLGDAWRCGISMASGTGLLDRASGEWSLEMLGLAGIGPEALNPIDDTPGRVGGALAVRNSRLRGVPLFAAIGDGAAGTVGSGADRSGLLAVNLGTSAAVRRTIDRSAPGPEAGWFDYWIDTDRRVIGAAVSNAGNAVREAGRCFGVSQEDLVRRLSSDPLPHPALVALPGVVRERAPGFPALEAGGAILGVRPDTDGADLVLATIDGVLERIARLIARLDPGGCEVPVLSGGLSRLQGIGQRMADLLGRSVGVAREPEASLRGAAVQAARGLGVGFAERSQPEWFSPHREREAVWNAYRERVFRLESAMGDNANPRG